MCSPARLLQGRFAKLSSDSAGTTSGFSFYRAVPIQTGKDTSPPRPPQLASSRRADGYALAIAKFQLSFSVAVTPTQMSSRNAPHGFSRSLRA
jgi:hypothetical protein